MKVNVHISDLFFNRDHSEAAQYEAKEFIGYDDSALLEDAGYMLDNLEALGVENLPTASEIVADYYARV